MKLYAKHDGTSWTYRVDHDGKVTETNDFKELGRTLAGLGVTRQAAQRAVVAARAIGVAEV